MIKPIIVKEKDVSEERIKPLQAELLTEGFKVTYFQVKMLLSRGINNVEEAKRFLQPALSTMHDPFLLKGMDVAVERIKLAVELGQEITIYGDYDVDGITSTSVLYKTLLEIGAKVDYYIPDRINEGYGINKNALETIKNKGSDLAISVDTGITAVEQAMFAKKINLDLIITDHHECQEIIPEAFALINPKQKACNYPFDMLAGVGVTYKLAQGLAKVFSLSDEFMLDLLEIVAVGTISDLVPLVDENRTFVYQAFKRMKTIHNIGLKALFKVAKKDTSKLTAGTIGFQIGPRLNAAGRLGDAKRGVKLFLSEDPDQALKIAEELNEENQKRRAMEEKILSEADEIVKQTIDVKKTKILVIAHPGWHHGVIGIVASRICEKYYRPTILLAIEDGLASGSARSVEGFSIFDALSSTKDLLDKFGGHEMAAGMSLDADLVPKLADNLNAYAKEHMTETTLVGKVKVEDRRQPTDITAEFIESLSVFEPYGMGNEEPRFLISGVIDAAGLMGKEANHFKMALSDGHKSIDAIGFYHGDYINYVNETMEVDVIGSLNVNEWKGFKKPQLFIKSLTYKEQLRKDIDFISEIAYLLFAEESETWQKHFLKKITDLNISLDRNFCAEVYKSIVKLDKRGQKEVYFPKLAYLNLNAQDLAVNISDAKEDKKGFDSQAGKIMAIKNLAAMKVFEELNLLQIVFHEEGYIVFTIKNGKKVELVKSILYNSMCCHN